MQDFHVGEMVKFTKEGIACFNAIGWPPVMFENEDGYKVVLIGSNCIHLYINEDYSNFSVPPEFLEKTGEMADFGKHPFKEFYLNKVTPESLPPHSYKSRLVTWLNNFYFQPKESYDIDFFWPNLDDSSRDFIVIWPNAKARMKGKAGRQPIKPGKFFKMLFKDISDKEVEKLVEDFKREFKPQEFTFHQTNTREGISEVYQKDYGNQRAFDTSSAYKRLCDSCMRYPTSDFETEFHPTEAFGSGDWTLFYAMNEHGHLGARCIAYFDGDTYQLGPVYANSQEAIDFLKTNLPDNCTRVFEGSWSGAKLLKLEDGYKIVGPYLDMASNLTDEGKYLVVDSSGDIEHGHEGYYGNNGLLCEHCEEYNGETTHIDSVGYSVCNTCLNCDFYVSEYDDEYYPDSRESAEVYYREHRYETWTLYQAEIHAIWSEEIGEWIKDDVAIETCDGEYVPEWLIGSDWLICNVDGLAYPEEDTIEHEEKVYAKVNAPEGSEHYRCDETEDMIEGKVA